MKKLILFIVGFGSILLHAGVTHANQFCFATAKTYYEQVYCELEAKGKTKGLPSFDQFKRNNEVVQSSLLKRPAERNRITLPPPKKIESAVMDIPKIAKKEIIKKDSGSKPVTVQQEVLKEDYIARKFDRSARLAGDDNCQMQAAKIQCSAKSYRLIGNRTNNHLAKGVLLETNKMALPLFQQGQPLNAYITSAYRQYIEKMCVIGLGAVTMTYARFAYLYEDLHSKGVNFVQRFELMYSYLKKDKAAMWISEKIPVNAQLAMQYCELLTENVYVCATQGQNYIFELEQ